jgi:hypothetical protein
MMSRRELVISEGRSRDPFRILGLLTAASAALAAVVAAVVFVFSGLAAIAAIIVAWVKREEWTLPAYRWSRDKTGRWSMTPWSARSDGHTDAETRSGQAMRATDE